MMMKRIKTNSQALSKCRIAPRSGLPRRAAHQEFRAFTLIELLVVVALIIILLSILVVAVSAATKSSQVARTRALMDSMRTGLIRFKEDIGYYPPILGYRGNPASPNDLRRLYDPTTYPPSPPAQPWPNDAGEIQKWYSATSPAEYLLGYGNHWQDGYGRVPGAATNVDWDQEAPPLGIRHPGPDGVWGASVLNPANPSLYFRMGNATGLPGNYPRTEIAANNTDQGKVYGPYIELKDPNLLASVDGAPDDYGNLKTYFPGDAGYNDDNPKVIVDYWGKPIRYYRRPYPQGALGQSHRMGTDIDHDGDVDKDDVVPTLSDWYFLRPFSVKPGTDRTTRFPDASGDKTTSSELDAAEFALFSSGPDRAFNHDLRVDSPDASGNVLTDMANRDNIVEVSP